uniref:Uncharacterized protein n=1 Tax=Lotus japonicus TaxID=34305 RepID=I3SE98_LOTJA|nr:unknown [Lotus japonicus]
MRELLFLLILLLPQLYPILTPITSPMTPTLLQMTPWIPNLNLIFNSTHQSMLAPMIQNLHLLKMRIMMMMMKIVKVRTPKATREGMRVTPRRMRWLREILLETSRCSGMRMNPILDTTTRERRLRKEKSKTNWIPFLPTLMILSIGRRSLMSTMMK